MTPCQRQQGTAPGQAGWWTLYAAAFGYVEALVVVYLRRLTGMPPGWDYPHIWAARGLPFSSAAIFAEMARQGVLTTEFTREAATILLLLGAAGAAGRTGRERLGLFLYTFAVWDLTYYLWLKAVDGVPAEPAGDGHLFPDPLRLVRAGLVPRPGLHAGDDCRRAPAPARRLNARSSSDSARRSQRPASA